MMLAACDYCLPSHSTFFVEPVYCMRLLIRFTRTHRCVFTVFTRVGFFLQQKHGIEHLLKAPLAQVMQACPPEPLLWFAQYFFLRSLRVQQLVFHDRPPRDIHFNDDGGGGGSGGGEGGDGEDAVPADLGMDGQVIKFTKHATVELYGTHPRHRPPAFFTEATLEACLSTAATGLLKCRPANVCAWLAIEFCRQSPVVDLVAWGGRVVNTACASGFIEEQAARHRKAAEPRAESPPPFSPARTMRPESPVGSPRARSPNNHHAW
jgi:hypothetical protein